MHTELFRILENANPFDPQMQAWKEEQAELRQHTVGEWAF
jgi:hypothetical protein